MMNTRRILITFLLLALSAFAFAQSPSKGIGYQALIRQADGKPLAKEAVNVKVSLKKGAADGAELYTETHDNVSTSANGLLNLEIGSKDATKFSAIDWATADAWIVVEVTSPKDPKLQLNLAQKMQAVPYAYYAEKVAGMDELKTKVDAIGEWAEMIENANPTLTKVKDLAAHDLENAKFYALTQIADTKDAGWLNGTLQVTTEIDLHEALDGARLDTSNKVIDNPFDAAGKATFTSKIDCSIGLDGSDLTLNMDKNAMGINDFIKFAVIYGLYGAMGEDAYNIPLESGKTVQAFCDMTGFKFEKGKVGDFNATISNMKIKKAENGKSKVNFIGEYIDGYGAEKMSVPFEYEHPALNKVRDILQNPNDPNFETALLCITSALYVNNGSGYPKRLTWRFGLPTPRLLVFDYDMSQPSFTPTGEIDWIAKKIVFTFPSTCDFIRGDMSVTVTITPAP